MHTANDYQIYKAAVQKVIADEEQLPSLPSITLKIRQQVSLPNTDYTQIARLIKLDPGLSTLLLKYAASPLYRRPVPPKTIEDVISIIGLQTLTNLVMLHSVKSLFVLKNLRIKGLYEISWRRMLYKAAISQFLAKKLGFHPAEEAMIASLLTEVGTLAILSSFSDLKQVPGKKAYYMLCRKYSKSLGVILLTKWGLDKYFIDMTHSCGNWTFSYDDQLSLSDVINLAVYSTVQLQKSTHDLPAIETLTAYQKLPPSLNEITDSGQLSLITANLGEIKQIIHAYKM